MRRTGTQSVSHRESFDYYCVKIKSGGKRQSLCPTGTWVETPCQTRVGCYRDNLWGFHTDTHTYSQTKTHAWIKSIIPAAPEIDRPSQLFLSGPFTFEFWIPIFILFLSAVSWGLFLLHLSLSTVLPPLINWRWRQLFYDGVPQLYAGGESVKNIEFARDDLWATKKFAFDNFKPLTIGHSIMMSRP